MRWKLRSRSEDDGWLDELVLLDWLDRELDEDKLDDEDSELLDFDEILLELELLSELLLGDELLEEELLDGLLEELLLLDGLLDEEEDELDEEATLDDELLDDEDELDELLPSQHRQPIVT